MSAKHTPGPWRWSGYYLMQVAPANSGADGLENNPYSTPCGHPIVCDGSAGGEYNATIDIDSADARLIAAAPDLLEALKAALAVLSGDFTKQSLISAMEIGAAAIKRAEGQL